MKLSEYPIKIEYNQNTRLYEGELSDYDINRIVFDNIVDDQTVCEYAIIFGISREVEMKSRCEKAYELIKNKRIKKIILTGSNRGISSKKTNNTKKDINEENKNISYLIDDDLSEARRMKNYCICLGLKESEIIIEERANDTIESLKLIKNIINLKKGDSLILVTSGYHMRRCIATSMKYIGDDIHYCACIAETGYFERSNYKNTSLGIELAKFDAFHIIRLARENKVYDIEI